MKLRKCDNEEIESKLALLVYMAAGKTMVYGEMKDCILIESLEFESEESKPVIHRQSYPVAHAEEMVLILETLIRIIKQRKEAEDSRN